MVGITKPTRQDVSGIDRKKDIGEIVERIVKNSIYKNESSLVENLFKLYGNSGDSNFCDFSYDSVENLYKASDEDTERLTEIDARLSEIDVSLGSLPEEESDDDLVSERESLSTEKSSIESNSMDTPQDIMEWWSVDKWLYDHLKNVGAPVMDTNYGYFWGRTETGQSLTMDDSLNKVAESIAN